MKIIAIGLFIIVCIQANAQNNLTSDSLSVRSIDEIVNQAFNIITRKDGEARDFNKLRDLYLPHAKLTILYHPTDSIPLNYETLSLDEFIEYLNENEEYYAKGFTQYELGKVVNEYNGIANVFQSFYAKDSENQESKGITSYQLLYFHDRWWISDLLWTTDSNGAPIPRVYLND